MTVPVKLKDIIEGLEFLTDEGSSYLNTTTGEVVYVTTEEVRAAEEEPPLKTSRNGSMTRFVSRGRYWKRITIFLYRPHSTSTNTALWSGSVSRSMMRTYGMICVTPYVGEARSGRVVK